jgi:hypothetical protein
MPAESPIIRRERRNLRAMVPFSLAVLALVIVWLMFIRFL